MPTHKIYYGFIRGEESLLFVTPRGIAPMGWPHDTPKDMIKFVLQVGEPTFMYSSLPLEEMATNTVLVDSW